MKKVISFCKYNPMQYVHLGDINSLKDFWILVYKGFILESFDGW